MRNHVWAILWKQLKDTLKNKSILIQFLMFPCLTVIMENAIAIEGMPEHFFTCLFGIMYVGMAPLVATSAIIAEEKEDHTLRVLRMCNVSAWEYLTGNAIYVIVICMLGSLVIALTGGYRGRELLVFLVLMLIGHFISMIMGAAIGVWSKNQMMATSLTVPVMMVISFLPMLAMFNASVERVARYVYSQQLYVMMNHPDALDIGTETIVVLAVNACLIAGVFVLAYRKVFTKR